MKSSLSFAAAFLVLLSGCAHEPVRHPDYARPLPPGASALRRLGPGDPMPDLAAAYSHRDRGLEKALDRSQRWFAAPSSRRFFPFENVCTFEQARASVAEFKRLLETSPGPHAFAAAVRREFDVWESVGYDGHGVVLFTGYFAPEFPASMTRTARFRYPLYRRPPDLATDPESGKPLGRRLPDGSLVPYPTRRQIEEGHLLAGHELVWLEDPLSAYIAQVNGSARLRLRDGRTIYVGYAGKTDRPYVGLGRELVKEGLIPPDRLGLPALRRVWREHRDRVRQLMYRNQSFVFFKIYSGKDWPAGSLGVPVTALSSLATDKSIYPRGGVVLVRTKSISVGGGSRPFLRFMLDQDTGGAIRAPGRADIFMGVGPAAETLAGGQYAEGRLYYFFLKPGVGGTAAVGRAE